jgi:hypothetical protein
VTVGDGLAIIGVSLAFVGIAWAVAWASVRSAAIRAEALGKIGAAAWTASKTTTTRRAG